MERPSTPVRRTARWLVVTALAAAALVVALPAASSAETASPAAQVKLTISGGTSMPTEPVTVLLTCDPDGGDHPTPDAACESLRAVDGNFKELPDQSGNCTAEVDPRTVTAVGYWTDVDGEVQLVDYEETFVNRCAARLGTDGVFNF